MTIRQIKVLSFLTYSLAAPLRTGCGSVLGKRAVGLFVSSPSPLRGRRSSGFPLLSLAGKEI
jgi:hypothetical protein